jgi:hypothetical protein
MPSTRLRRDHELATGAILVLCLFAVFGPGCQKRTAMAAPPMVIVPATPEDATPPPVIPAAQPHPEPSEPVTRTDASVPAPPAVKKPHKKNPAPVTTPESADTSPTSKPTAPQISSGVSPAALAALQQKAQSKVAATEKNLLQAAGRQITAAQHDESEKIRSFLSQAQTAANASDWALASNLAEKAYVLSVDLLNSF